MKKEIIVSKIKNVLNNVDAVMFILATVICVKLSKVYRDDMLRFITETENSGEFTAEEVNVVKYIFNLCGLKC